MSEVRLTDGDLGPLVAAAASYDVRLRFGVIPERVWALLSPEWRDKIIGQQDDDDCIAGTVLGTERRRKDHRATT